MEITIKNKPKKYTPFMKGRYDVSPGFYPLITDYSGNDIDNYIFQLDDNFPEYLKNKNECRQEDIHKYFRQFKQNENTLAIINKFIIENLLKTYPEFFQLEATDNLNILKCRLTGQIIKFSDEYLSIETTEYLSLFDALCAQVPEDIVICQLDGQTDWLSSIHLCSPSYWSAEEKIGKDFSDVHIPVAGMEKIRKIYRPILESVFKKGPFFRFAWEVNTNSRLNHHPEGKKGFSIAEWNEKPFKSKNPELYVRVERQTLTGFTEENIILFTIRTYYTDVNHLTSEELIGLKHALSSMSPETLQYKRITNSINDITTWLEKLSQDKH